ncbi:phage virion morphogenesis protein [Acetobacter sp. P1H12_c]|uniref:phage virion morphogenesis protein n=1 Tax=Acetobacter sp. P1H12_c TaxID=2762621 RepID=UPI001C04181C|nr:phage virion morphogenesis protein [Acetobacter sp. P1H12_c]
MGGVSVLGSTQQIRDALGRIADIGRDPSSVLNALGAGIVRHTEQRMNAGVDPRGVRWDSYAPLNPYYASSKKGPRILIASRQLQQSLIWRSQGNVLVWGSNKIYSRIHQLGGIIQPKNKRWLSFEMGGRLWHLDNVEIPARPYLGFTDQDRTFLIEELEDYLARAMRG